MPRRSVPSSGIAPARRWRLAPGIALAATAGLAVAGGGWHFSNLLLRPGANLPLESGVVVTAVTDSTVTLSGSTAARRGDTWFLEWPGGAGLLSGRPASNGSRVTRRFRTLEGRIAAGDRVNLRPYPYSGDPLRIGGLRFEDVRVTSELGKFPAWVVPAPRSTWVVLVHGMNAGRGEALRVLPLIHRLGLPSLTITYRNDPGAPRSPDALFHLGASEWRDLEAGVRYALERGAGRVVLAGFSMGGAVIAEFLRRSSLADSVAGVVFDAPTLDWGAVVALGARNEGGLAPYLAPVAKWMVTARTEFRWSETGARAWPAQFGSRIPVLLFHGTADDRVPFAVSESFARALGDRVTFVRSEGAGHVRSWNQAPERYEAALAGWLGRVAIPPP